MKMKEVFQPDNLFNTIMTKIFDLILLSVLWIIGCIPVITIGASTSALYYVTMKMVEDRDSGIIKTFAKGYKDNLKKSIPITCLLLLCIAILAVDFHVLGAQKTAGASVMYGGCIALAVIVTAVFGYTFPLLAKFENTVKNTLVNGAKLAITHLPQTLVIVVLNLLPGVWFLVSPATFSLIFWIWVFAGTGIVAYVNSMLLVPMFQALIDEQN